MQFLPIDLAQVIAVVMGTSIVLVPVIGLTARFAFKPLVQSLVALRTPPESAQRIAELERRVAELEQQARRELPGPVVTAPSLGEPVIEPARLRG
ncbi:MAG TPA: hypothetical protein VGK67_12080 [Myxococcales bacterium]|jgi:hypothetical protein